MSHVMSGLQALAHEARTTDQERLRTLRDDRCHQHSTESLVRPSFASGRGGDSASIGLASETRFTQGRRGLLALTAGLTEMGLGDIAEASLHHFSHQLEAA